MSAVEVIVAVRVTNPKGRDAGWSDPKIFDVCRRSRIPPIFTWRPTPRASHSRGARRARANFVIFRKTEQQQKPVLLATATEPNYIDMSAEYGKTYQYSIQAVRDKIESNVVGPQTITPIDTFPPAVPSGLTASIGIGAVELAWNRNTESDFKEYRVLRSEEGGPFVEVARGLDAPVYSDHAIQSGKHYRYEVLSVG